METNATIGFIGCGHMGESLVTGLLANGYPAERIFAADPSAERRQALQAQFKISCDSDNLTIASRAQIIILACKPQQIKASIASIYDGLIGQDKLVISIAAGVTLLALKQYLPAGTEVIRVMPNTPAQVQAGMSALCAETHVSKHAQAMAAQIMQAVGSIIWVKDDHLMDVITAISGSGPAYVLLLLEMLMQFGLNSGLTREEAHMLAVQTGFGACKMAVESELDLAALRQSVTSPGGTTEAALNVLQKQGVRELFHAALSAARDRGQALSCDL